MPTSTPVRLPPCTLRGVLIFLRRHRVLAVLGGVSVVAVLAAPSTPAPRPAAVHEVAPPPRKKVPAITLAFGGDVHFEGALRRKLASNPAGILAGVAPLLRTADVAMVNLETAITTRGTAVPNKQYTFRAPAAALTALRSAGVDTASMANNHGLDFGPVGLSDTFAAAAAARFPIIGIGRTDTEAYRPYRTVVRGQRIAVIAATQVIDGQLISAWTAGPHQAGLASAKDVPRLVRAVKEARKTADTLVVYLHWGTEGAQCPTLAQRSLADTLVAAGADIVVGSHAHALQGAGREGNAFVAYGLGNFAFYARTGLATQSGVLTLTVTGRHVDSYRWSPAVLTAGAPTLLAGPRATAASASWQGLRGCAGLTP